MLFELVIKLYMCNEHFPKITSFLYVPPFPYSPWLGSGQLSLESYVELKKILWSSRTFFRIVEFSINLYWMFLSNPWHTYIYTLLTNLWACHYQTQGQIFIYTRGLQGIIRFLMWISSVSELVLDSFARSKTRKVVKFFIFIDGFLIKQHLQT